MSIDDPDADPASSRIPALCAPPSADAEHAAVPRTAVALLESATAGLDPARPGDWPTWRLLMPHVNAAIDLLADDLDPAVLARLLAVSAVGTEALLGAVRLGAAEKLAEAEELYRQVIADRTRVLGGHHPDTAAARHELALMGAES